jgi:hypothetical protein
LPVPSTKNVPFSLYSGREPPGSPTGVPGTLLLLSTVPYRAVLAVAEWATYSRAVPAPPFVPWSVTSSPLPSVAVADSSVTGLATNICRLPSAAGTDTTATQSPS